MVFNELLIAFFPYPFAKCFGELVGSRWVDFTIEGATNVFPKEAVNKFLVLRLLGDKEWLNHRRV